MLSFSYADASGTAPKLEVIEQITIASDYPLNLKQLITSPSDEQGKKEVKITNHNNFRNQDNTIKDKRTYNFAGEYKITFELVDKNTGASTTKTSTIKVVPQNTLKFRHSSANELGKDQEHTATDLEAEVAYKSGRTTPYKFKLRYLDDRTNSPVEGLNLYFAKNSHIYSGSLGQDYFTTNANGEYEFSMTENQFKEYSIRDRQYLTDVSDIKAHMLAYQLIDFYKLL